MADRDDIQFQFKITTEKKRLDSLISEAYKVNSSSFIVRESLL